ncbi:MAG: MFS transporter [Dehalococcoidia bacterium]|nr:MFS transporter [Dehalococcoidia bacterium]
MADTRTAMMRLSALVGERALFENEGYRRLWLARLLSATPVNAIVYTMLILVVNETGKSFFSSLFVAAYIAPTALLGTVSGVLVDRMPKGVVLAGSNLARAALCVLLAISTGNVLTIYIIAVLFAVASQLSGPAESSALPAIVDARDLTAANSLNNLGGLISQVGGLMILPAVFLKTVGPEALAVLCAALFLIAAFEFLLVPGLGGAVGQIPISIDDARERFAEAWERLAADSVSYIAVVMVVLASTTSLVVVTLLPRYSTSVLGVNSENAIFLVTPAAAGIWLALRFVRRVAGRYAPSKTIGLSFAALVGGVMLLAFIRPLGAMLSGANPLGLFDPGPFGETSARIVITGFVAAGLAFAYTFLNIVGRSVVNERIPREMQGRVFAAQTVLTNLASIPPILLAGLLADALSVTVVFFFVGFACALLALFYAARNIASPARVAY